MGKLDKIKSVLSSVAPSIATALGGPLAGLAVGSLSKALLGDPAAGQGAPEKIEDAVLNASNPDVLLKLKQAENEFQLALAEHGVDLEKLAEADRASARQRQMALRDYTPTVLGYLVVALTASLEAYVLLRGLPAAIDPVIVGRILGTLDAALTLVLSYFFGSSAGSDRKTEILAGANQKKT
ncbi:MAG TPA: hypothetical protein VG028_04185 [Terriglobia bacterium]|nr:hypothetical protein [Terriglobia bacterium]